MTAAGAPLDLAAIELRLEVLSRLTPPYGAEPWRLDGDLIRVTGEGGQRTVAEVYGGDTGAEMQVLGDWIAAARTDVPALLAEVRRLRVAPPPAERCDSCGRPGDQAEIAAAHDARIVALIETVRRNARDDTARDGRIRCIGCAHLLVPTGDRWVRVGRPSNSVCEFPIAEDTPLHVPNQPDPRTGQPVPYAPQAIRDMVARDWAALSPDDHTVIDPDGEL